MFAQNVTQKTMRLSKDLYKKKGKLNIPFDV